MLSLRSRHQESMASRVQRAGLLLETPGAVQNHVSVIQIHVCRSAHAEAAKLIGSFLETCCTLSAWPICVVVRAQIDRTSSVVLSERMCEHMQFHS